MHSIIQNLEVQVQVHVFHFILFNVPQIQKQLQSLGYRTCPEYA